MNDDRDFTETKGGAQLAPMPMSGFQLAPTNFEEAWRVSQMLSQSAFCPNVYKGKPQDVLACLAFGNEVGLSPMNALQSIMIVNGRPSLWGDGLIGVVRRDASVLSIKEWLEGEGDTRTAFCTLRRSRNGEVEETTRSFSVADAKKAKLWGKEGPWQNYSDRMLQMRARGFTLRDGAADITRGMAMAEEQFDAQVVNVTPPTQEEVPPHLTQKVKEAGWSRERYATEARQAEGEDLLERLEASIALKQRERVSKQPPAHTEELLLSEPQRKKLFATLGEKGIKDRDERMNWAAKTLAVEVTSFSNLTEAQAATLIEAAEAM